jgi:hypothetical protein
MFAERDRLLKEWKEMKEWEKESTRKFVEESAAKGIHFGFNTERDMYGDMIKNLSSDDYEKWDNYPHERPYIYETEIVEEAGVKSNKGE